MNNLVEEYLKIKQVIPQKSTKRGSLKSNEDSDSSGEPNKAPNSISRDILLIQGNSDPRTWTV